MKVTNVCYNAHNILEIWNVFQLVILENINIKIKSVHLYEIYNIALFTHYHNHFMFVKTIAIKLILLRFIMELNAFLNVILTLKINIY